MLDEEFDFLEYQRKRKELRKEYFRLETRLTDLGRDGTDRDWLELASGIFYVNRLNLQLILLFLCSSLAKVV
jgi:hypothetical protein